MELHKRAALVTGGGRGIGRAIALALARQGADVCVCSRTVAEVERVAAEVAEIGPRGLALTGDVANGDDVADIAARTRQGIGDVDILVNNAGVFWTRRFLDTTADQLDEMLAINLRGAFLMTKAVLPAMIERGHGTIINIASVAGKRGYVEQSAYCASKHAILGMTKALALELEGTGVRLSAISPGGVDTTLIADARPELDRSSWMDVDDIAQLVILLASLPAKAAIDEIVVRRRAASPTAFF
jgi:NAD(P)-dependent dehydrogenase (short-subunit alcohol dehydrogenase family)